MFGRLFATFQDRYVHKSIIFAIDGIASVASTLLAFLFTHLVVRFENLDSAIKRINFTFGLKEGELTFLFVGRLTFQKNLELIIHALAILKEKEGI